LSEDRIEDSQLIVTELATDGLTFTDVACWLSFLAGRRTLGL